MKVGITGHQRLKELSSWNSVKIEMIDIIRTCKYQLIGVTSLAIGADQLFAEIILQRGGEIEAVIPFDGYELKFEEGSPRETYRQLLGRATQVEVLKKVGSDEEAYLAAGKRVVDLSDLIIAVWDGEPAAGLGGTADVVSYALNNKKTVEIINPNKL